MKNQKITLDSLAGMIKNEFDNVGHRFDKIESEMKEGFKELTMNNFNIVNFTERERVK